MEDIKVCRPHDPDYPSLLKQIHKHPEILYYRGEAPSSFSNCISVVGTRTATSYGRLATERLSGEIARAGCTIVSGLAYGVDSWAHARALEVRGRTIAVLGTGIDDASLYPAEKRGLARSILDHGGCILSEHPPGTKGLKYHFVQRNRIIAGLSHATVVVEAPAKSGALITAHFALHENREVFAVPGPITSLASEGTNMLLKKGAHCLTSVKDIQEVLEYLCLTLEQKEVLNEVGTEQHILCILAEKPLHIDEIAHATSLDIQSTVSTLLILEMKGLVKNIGSMQYIKL
ncbi:DNA-protecting protein DprA [Candidatus Uhrbacteria bacterium]|nr:DNA-protecting protein DprA [Candidatus Uhrbacteria bacterium]